MSDEPEPTGFLWQADVCRRSGSPLTADVLEAARAVIDRTTETGARILDWPGKPIEDALPLRFAGGLHALARREPDGALGRYYATREGDLAAAVDAAVRNHDAELSRWLDGPPQTNEVGRAAALMAGLLWIADGTPLTVELLEIGSSAGLNLQLDRFACDLGGTRVGAPDSAVLLAPDWQGSAPAAAAIKVASRRGVDLQPLDPGDPGVAERLAAFVWADQTERLARVEAAIALACSNPAQVEQGDAADWTEARLAEPQPEGVTRVLMHSVVWPYLPDATRERIIAALEAAGARADATRPLAWVRMEGRPMDHMLRVRRWPGGEDRELADCHPHASWIRWRG